MTQALLIVALVVFTLASGFFSASETAFFSLSPLKLRAYRWNPRPRFKTIASLMTRPRGLLVTILMMNVLVNLLVQNAASSLFAGFPGWGLKVGLPLALTLLFGEVIPKTIALPNNERVASLTAPVLSVFHKGLRPLRRALTVITTRVSRCMFFFLRKEPELSRDELLHALKTSEQHGVLTADETDLIKGYLHFHEVSVKEVLRPRDEVLVFSLTRPLNELIDLFLNQECSRVPISPNGIEEIEGVVDATDFFLLRDRIESTENLSRVMRKPFFVPETMAATTLWQKFRAHNENLAVVVDEYGSVAGIVTREDLVEEVVGEIADRRDQKSLYTRAGADVIIASGKLELNELNELFDTHLISEASLVTVGGWLSEQLGAIPQAGTKYQAHPFLFHVLAAEPNRIRRLYIRRLKA